MNNPKNLLCFIGPPGAGKGTYSNLCFDLYKDELDLHRFSVGDELRAMNSTKPSGDLSDISHIRQIFDRQLEGSKRNVIVDGYPRGVEQLELLVKLKSDQLVNQVTLFDIGVSEVSLLLDRLGSRNNCSQCGYSGTELICPKCDIELAKRTDDLSSNVVDRRIQIYYDSRQLILEEAEKSAIKVYKFDSSSGIDATFELIRTHFIEVLK